MVTAHPAAAAAEVIQADTPAAAAAEVIQAAVADIPVAVVSPGEMPGEADPTAVAEEDND